MITTPRLLLRPWRKTDLPAMAAVSGDKRVMRYFPGVQDEAHVKGFIGRQHLQQQERGYCFFAAELRATGAVIGFIGLSYLDKDVDFAPCVEIGWRLHPDTWGKGLAPEGAKACIEFGFTELGLTEIYAETPLVNLPSQRVMEKIGMERFCTFMHPELGEFPEIAECVVYRVVRGRCVFGRSGRSAKIKDAGRHGVPALLLHAHPSARVQTDPALRHPL